MSDIPRDEPLAGRRLAYAVALLVGGGGIWGLTFSVAKIVTGAGRDPIGVAFLYGLVGGLLLLPYCVLRHGGVRMDRDHLRFYVIAGVLGTALPTAVLFSAAVHLPAGILAMVTALVPLITYVFAMVLAIERYGVRRSLGIGLGFGSILMIVLPETSLPDPSMVGWVLLALIVPTAYSAENVYIAVRRPAAGSSVVLLCGMLFAGAAMLAPLVWTTDAWVSLPLPWTAIEWWILALIVVNTTAYLMFIELVRIAGPVFAGQTGYVVTASGVFWGIFFFDETHSVWVWGALAVLLAGLALVNPRPARGKP